MAEDMSAVRLALSVERSPCKRKVMGSNPGLAAYFSDPGYTDMSFLAQVSDLGGTLNIRIVCQETSFMK